jgi:arginase
VTLWNRAVHDAVYGEVANSRMPILLGGDHSLSIGSISAIARRCREQGRTLRILWLDAHADFNTNVLTPSGNIHGMPVACLCGLGPKSLIEMSGRVPAIQASSIRQIGIRSVDQGERSAWCTKWVWRSSTCVSSMRPACARRSPTRSNPWTATRICT